MVHFFPIAEVAVAFEIMIRRVQNEHSGLRRLQLSRKSQRTEILRQSDEISKYCCTFFTNLDSQTQKLQLQRGGENRSLFFIREVDKKRDGRARRRGGPDGG